MRRAGPILIVRHRRARVRRRLLPGPHGPGTRAAADGAWRTIETKLGLDLQGGLRVEYQALDPKDGVNADARGHRGPQGHHRAAREPTGVAEPVVWTQGTDRVVVELPGVTDRSHPPARRPDRPASTSSRSAHDAGDPEGQVLDLEQTRRCSAATRSRPPTRHRPGPARGRLRAATATRAPTCSPTTRATTSASTSRSSSTASSISAPVIQNPIPNGQVQISRRRPRRLPADGGQRPRHGPALRLAAVPGPGAGERQIERDARRGVPRPEPPGRR